MATSTIKPIISVESLEGSTTLQTSLGYYSRLVSLNIVGTPNSAGYVELDVTGFGLDAKPSLVLPVSCFADAICSYDFDASTATTAKISVRNYSGGVYTSTLRIIVLMGIR